MTMPPAVRKFALITHLTVSVGWIGAVLAYLALIFTAMAVQNTQTLIAAWSAMSWIGSYVIVPLSIASLLTGLVMSLGTHWGLFRHYWVVFSLVLTTFATYVLIGHIQAAINIARIAAQMNSLAVAGLTGELRDAGGGLVVLLVVQVLNVYKPRGLTPYGLRKQRAKDQENKGLTHDAFQPAASSE
jgi:hypothetical protein